MGDNGFWGRAAGGRGEKRAQYIITLWALVMLIMIRVVLEDSQHWGTNIRIHCDWVVDSVLKVAGSGWGEVVCYQSPTPRYAKLQVLLVSASVRDWRCLSTLTWNTAETARQPRGQENELTLQGGSEKLPGLLCPAGTSVRAPLCVIAAYWLFSSFLVDA